MPDHYSIEQPSSRQLFRGTITTLGISLLLLVTTVLPAEFGLDPTGLGQKMGLTELYSAPEVMALKDPSSSSSGSGIQEQIQSVQPVAGLKHNAVVPARQVMQKDTLSLTLQPGQGAEIKALMDQGQSLTFHWQTSDAMVVYVDMHGESPDAGKDEFTSYWEGQMKEASGTLTAPFKGTHG